MKIPSIKDQHKQPTETEAEPDMLGLPPPMIENEKIAVQTEYLPTAQEMSDDELELYTKRLSMRHKRLSRKWLGLRNKHKKDECPYCGMYTQGGYCKMHQGMYDEYISSLVIKQNRKWSQ